MNIAERRLPQDGRIAVTIDGRSVDMRVSSLPTQYGESVVLRILDKGGVAPQPGPARLLRAQPARRSTADPQAARHLPGDRPDGFGQDDHAVLGDPGHPHARRQHHHGRGPDRVRAGGHPAVQRQREGRPDVRPAAARHSAPGPGHHLRRRDPRRRDRRDRLPGRPDRPPGLLDAALQRRRRGDHAPAEHGRGPVPGRLVRDRRAGPAPGAQGLPASAPRPSPPARRGPGRLRHRRRTRRSSTRRSSWRARAASSAPTPATRAATASRN